MEENYRLLFVFRTRDISMLYCLGMDYTKGAMFCVMFYSPNDDIQLDYNTNHYPQKLINYLRKEKFSIDKGLYDIRMWELNLYNKN
ncbi:hypothetical protein [Priestia megaterium]|uniref:hypothetical protein n=1 Tax=Priestia megaterium TaxID=1404 RepID=UPI000BFD4F3E|nr:hypothetical protein [Priestia megaterium]PGX80398.1 hypothetical protein COE31_04825 [Priestia megaterium]